MKRVIDVGAGVEGCVADIKALLEERLGVVVSAPAEAALRGLVEDIAGGGAKGAEAAPEGYYNEIYADRENMFSHTPYAMEERLINAVKSGDEEAALSALKAIERAGGKAVLARDGLRSAKNSVICTCALLARASIQAGVSPESAFALSDAVIRMIEGFSTRERTLRYEEDALVSFLKLVRREKMKDHSRPVHRAIHYVDAHLTAKLKLADIARYAGVSAGYLSVVFSREVGMPLSEYILMRKVRESSYFIRNREHSASDVAQLYGFSGQSYYISVFKRFMGVTPGEYRTRGGV